MIRVTDDRTLDALDELEDEYGVEKVHFIRDDGGRWYAQVTVDHGSFSTGTWWVLDFDDPQHELLEGIIDAAREF